MYCWRRPGSRTGLRTTADWRRAGVVAACLLTAALYLAFLATMGMIGPDEPRYASIGRAMADSGDWVTPRLWGKPWFEKPALLYWMTAAGFRAGLGMELAPRLPVALLSFAFLLFFWWRVRIGWDEVVAWTATGMLATTGGWLAYSHIAVTDLPLSALFSAALLLALPWVERRDRTLLPVSAACLGLAVLAKGLVPGVLFVPIVILGWKRVADWFSPGPLMAFLVVSLPWYTLCTLANGNGFLKVFFLEHQLGRFSSSALQHVQPWWFYGPSLLLLLFPWFPLLPLARLADRSDPKVRALLAVTLFGFVFFSASLNKLPSYVLPLLPCLCILMALGLRRAEAPARWMVVPAAMLALLPVIAGILPTALAHGLRAANIPWPIVAVSVAAGAAIGFVFSVRAPAMAPILMISVAGLAFLWFQINTFPALDQAASARTLWLKENPDCARNLPRAMLYGLSYYKGAEVPPCSAP